MLRFLIVDDSKSARARLESVLSQYGKCRMAENGREALNLVTSALNSGHHYDLVTLDLEMPVLGGLEAAKELVRLQNARGIDQSEHVKVIVISKIDDPNTLYKAHFEGNAPIFITKPYDDRTVREALVNLELIPPDTDPGEYVAC